MIGGKAMKRSYNLLRRLSSAFEGTGNISAACQQAMPSGGSGPECCQRLLDRCMCTSSSTYETVRVDVEQPAGTITIARPKALNAVSSKVRPVNDPYQLQNSTYIRGV